MWYVCAYSSVQLDISRVERVYHRVVYFSELQEQVTSLQMDKRWLQSQLEEKKLSLDKCRVCYLPYLL